MLWTTLNSCHFVFSLCWSTGLGQRACTWNISFLKFTMAVNWGSIIGVTHSAGCHSFFLLDCKLLLFFPWDWNHPFFLDCKPSDKNKCNCNLTLKKGLKLWDSQSIIDPHNLSLSNSHWQSNRCLTCLGQGSPEALASGENRHLLNLGAGYSGKKYMHFWGWLSK